MNNQIDKASFVASIVIPFYVIMPFGRWLKKKFSKPKNNP